MMSQQARKLAMLIVNGSEEDMKKPEDKAEDMEPSMMGLEAAMEKLIEGVHSRDTKKALDAFMELCEMKMDYKHKDEY